MARSAKNGTRKRRAPGAFPSLKRLIAFLLLCVLGLLMAPSAALTQDRELPQQIRFLEARALALKREIGERGNERKALYMQVRKLSAEIEQIKSQPQPSFLDRRRLDGLLADSQQAGARLEALVADISKKQAEYDLAVKAVYAAYTREMDSVSDQISSEKTRGRIVSLTKYFVWLRDRREQFRPPGANLKTEDFLSVEIQPDETRPSLLSKQDLLRKRLARVEAIIGNLEKEIKGLKKDLALSDQMESLVREFSLFDDGVVFNRTPRTYTPKKEGEEPGPTPSPPSAGQPGETAAGVHLFPIEQESKDRGTETIMDSIEVEIRRLENMLQYMHQVKKKLVDQIGELQERLKKMPNAALPAAVRSPARAGSAEIGNKEGSS